MPFRQLLRAYEPDEVQTMTEALYLATAELNGEPCATVALAKIILKHVQVDNALGAISLAELAVREYRFGYDLQDQKMPTPAPSMERNIIDALEGN